MEKDIKFEINRYFYDSWALLVYVIPFLQINALLLLDRRNIEDITKIIDYVEIFRIVGINSIFVVLSVFISYLMMICMPRIIIYTSIFILPSLMIFFTFYFSGGIGAMTLISTAIMLIYFAFYFFVISKHLDYICKMVSASTSILMRNIGAVFLMMLLLGLFSFAQFAIIVFADQKTVFVQELECLSLIILFWAMFNMHYFNQILVSTLAVLEITKNNEVKRKIRFAFSNTYSALGSICFAGLILPLITVIRLFVTDLRDRNERRSDGRNIFFTIIFIIPIIIVSELGDVISCTNRMAFPFLAQYGRRYKDSVTKSYDLILNSDSKNIAAFAGIDLVIGLLSFILTLLSIFFNRSLFENFTYNFNSIIIAIFGLFLIFYWLFGMLSMISAGCLAFIYVDICAPETLSNYDHDLSDTFTQKKIEMK